MQYEVIKTIKKDENCELIELENTEPDNILTKEGVILAIEKKLIDLREKISRSLEDNQVIEKLEKKLGELSIKKVSEKPFEEVETKKTKNKDRPAEIEAKTKKTRTRKVKKCTC